MFRLIIFLIGVWVSLAAGVYVHQPAEKFIDSAEKSYLRMRALEDTITTWAGDLIDEFSDKYNEFTRLFGREVAEKEVQEEIIKEEDIYFLDKVFEYDIPKWISIIVWVLTLSVYFNIISFLAFLLKPVLFLMPKKN